MTHYFSSPRILAALIVLSLALALAPKVSAQDIRFAVVGDFGNGSQPEADVAALIDSKNVSFVATVGDNVYSAANNGTPWNAIDAKIGKFYHQYMHPYPGVHGAGSADGRNNFFPLLGNHDYGHGGQADIPLLDCVDGGGLNSCSDTEGAWYDFFNLPGNERYYSVRRGSVEIFAFSDYYRDPDWNYDMERNGVVQWLKNALQRSTATWKVVLLHFPPYASVNNGGYDIRRYDYKSWGADAVIAGHVHNYERLSVDGIPYFVNGAGGVSVGRGGGFSPYSIKRVTDDFGAMIIDANDSRIRYDYFTRDGQLRDRFVQTAEEPPADDRYTWKSVPIGGGGYITGVSVHPRNGNLVYARTDVGGSYRFDPANDSWIALNESIPFDDRGMYGVESLALDPSNQNVVYQAIGSRPDICQCDILKSTNRGASWTAAGLSGVRIAGNNVGRWSGERLAVDPYNSNIIYFASRFDGLWRSGAASRPGSWQRVAAASFARSEPANNRARGALSFVAFDPRSGANGRSQTIYVGDFNRGVYRSTDGGARFSRLAGSPTNVERGVVGSDGTLYVTHLGGVSRYAAGSFSNITPSGGARAFSGVDVSASAANVVVAAERSESALGNNRVYRSTDRGATWREANKNNVDLDLAGTWGGASNWSSATADVAIDPTNSNRVWLSSWFGVWRTNNFSAARSNWKPIVKGHEELVMRVLVSPTEGAPLISGGADHSGFRHTDPTRVAPNMRLGDIEWQAGRQRIQDTEGLDFAAANPNVVVRVGGRYWGPSGDGEYSMDNGRTWTLFQRPAADVQGGIVAITANANNVVWIPQNRAPYASNNMGASWSTANFSPAISGALIKSRWSPKQLLAADRVASQRLYLLDYPARRFYISEDGGYNWQGRFVFTGIRNSDWDYQSVKARPDRSGEVWVNSANDGLFRSTNGGVSFSKIPGVTRALSFGFGKAKPGSDVPTLFLYGKVNGFGNEYSVFRSTDLATSWQEIRGSATMGNGPSVMAGDKQVYGRVYIGTGGRGIYVGSIANDTPPAASFRIDDVSVNEGDSRAIVSVRLREAANAPVSVGYATTPGSASRREDFYGAAGRLNFAVGETRKTFSVQIRNDQVPEARETINTRLFKSSGPAIAKKNGTISIVDDD